MLVVHTSHYSTASVTLQTAPYGLRTKPRERVRKRPQLSYFTRLFVTKVDEVDDCRLPGAIHRLHDSPVPVTWNRNRLY